MTPREQLAETLRQSRIAAGFESHAALAKKLNVTRPVVSKAENPAHPGPLTRYSRLGQVPRALRWTPDRAGGGHESGTPDWFMP